MDIEITTKDYWDQYWAKHDLPSYDLTMGLFYSYHLLFQEYISLMRKQLGRESLRIADFGCGNGLILKYLKENFIDIEVWGIEYSDAFYEAEKVSELYGLEFKLLRTNILDGIPQEIMEKMDIVISVGLIEHFINPTEILNIMKTSLANNGCLITIIPNFEGVYNFLWRLYDTENYSLHHPITTDALIKIYDNIGLNEIKLYHLGTPVFPNIHRPRVVTKKMLNKVVSNLNKKLLQRLIKRQKNLVSSYPMSPIIACAGFLSRV